MLGLSSIGEEVRSECRNNLRNLLRIVCRELKKLDKHKSGILTAANFSAVLEKLGLQFGSWEVDLVMRYCHVTADGYVVYKYLLMEFYHSSKSLAIKDNVKEALCPSDIIQQDSFLLPNKFCPKDIQGSNFDECRHVKDDIWNIGLHILTPEKSEIIRKLYTQWDRGLLKDHELLGYLRKMKVPVTKEAERLLSNYGPSRTLPFSKLMQCLYINDISNAYRKTRLLSTVSYPSSFLCRNDLNGAGDAPPNSFYDYNRNPITWDNIKFRNYHTYPRILENIRCFNEHKKLDCINNISISEIVHQENDNFTEMDTMQRICYVKQLVCDYLDNYISSFVFRNELRRVGIHTSMEIDNLVRQHDYDNQGSFKDFVKIIMMQNFNKNSDILPHDVPESKRKCNNSCENYNVLDDVYDKNAFASGDSDNYDQKRCSMKFGGEDQYGQGILPQNQRILELQNKYVDISNRGQSLIEKSHQIEDSNVDSDARKREFECYC